QAVVASTGEAKHWSHARWDSAGLAPDPATTREPVIQFYVARTWGWRGIFGVNSWVVVIPRDAPRYTRYAVVGCGVVAEAPAVRIDARPPDGYWDGNRPVLLAEKRGGGVDRLIGRIEEAVSRYPYLHEYRLWPGPNSNTFVAHLARAVPEMHVVLPPTAI